MLQFVRSEPSQAADPHPLFEVQWYLAGAGIPDGSAVDVLTHFLLIGEPAGHSPHPLVDPSVLRREHACAVRDRVGSEATAGRATAAQDSPLTVYASGGLLDARTHELFDGAAYRRMHPDVRRAAEVPLVHYVRSGRDERPSTLEPVAEAWTRERWGVAPDVPFDPVGQVRRLGAAELMAARDELERELRNGLKRFLDAPEDAPEGAPERSLAFDWPDRAGARVTVIVPVWNQAFATYGCLRALHAAAQHTPLRVHVVDNGSTDETAVLLSRYPGIEVTTWPDNRGFGAAVNHAVALATTEHVLLLNNDAFVEPHAIDHALDVLDAEADAGAVCARIVLPNGMLQEAGSFVVSDGTSRGYLRGAPSAHPSGQHRRDVDFGSAAFLLVRSEVFAALEGFRPQFGIAYGADVDLMLRMWEAGWRTVYEPRCVVHHLESASAGSRTENAARMNQASRLIRALHAPLLDTREGERFADAQALARIRQAGPRIVMIDDEVPDPRAGSGQARAGAILRALLEQRQASVTLLTRTHEPSDSRYRAARERARAIDPRIELHEGLQPDLWLDWLDAHAAVVDAVWVSRAHNMIDLQRELRRRGRTQLAIPTIFDSEAVVTERDASLAAHLGSPLTLEELEARTQAEFGCADGADVVVGVVEHEAERYRSRTTKPVLVLGHRVEPSAARRSPPRTSRVLFVGRLAEEHSPNALGLRWFLDEVWPTIEARTEATLDIVGLAGVWLQPHRSERIRVHGTVDDLRPFYADARVFVAPTHFAAGIPHKVHEAASFGLPVVTTPLIAGQLGTQGARSVLVAGDPEAFATEIAQLLRDDEAWLQWSSRAHSFAQAECSATEFDATVGRILDVVAGHDIAAAARAPERAIPASAQVRLQVDRDVEHRFLCKLCRSTSQARRSTFHRELPSCTTCGSTVRHRQLVAAVEFALSSRGHGGSRSAGAPKVLGMSDHPLISRWCEDAAFDYTNTFLDEPPKLDITAVPPSRRGTVDVLISSDVLEHVMFPIADALRGMFDCLVPGGHLVLTCPYRKRGPSTEHFPWVRSYRVTETGIVVGADADGLELKLEDPVFHGGSGKTLEMRMLSLAVLVQELRTIGFDPIDVLDEPVPGLGIFPTDEMGVLVCRRPEGTS